MCVCVCVCLRVYTWCVCACENAPVCENGVCSRLEYLCFVCTGLGTGASGQNMYGFDLELYDVIDTEVSGSM